MVNRFSRHYGWWLTALAILILVGGLRAVGQLQPLENAAADMRAQVLVHEVRSDIVIVGIDAASLQALNDWPWPRRHHAQLMDQLRRASPASVFLDFDFSAQTMSLDDALLEAALAKPRDFPVSLPTYFQNASGADADLVVSKPLRRFARRTEMAVVDGFAGPDGMTREWRNLRAADGVRMHSVIDPHRLLQDEQNVLIDYSISPTSFTYLSYVDVMEGRVPRTMLDDKTIFVGATAVELGDLLAVPVHRSLPGIVVQALATESVTQGAPRTSPTWLWVTLLAGWAALTTLVYGSKWQRNLAVLALALAAIAGTSLLAFAYGRWVIDSAAPMIVVGLMFVAATVRSLDAQTWRALSYVLGVRRRDALLKSVVQSSTDCIVCVDEAGIIRTANPAASKLFGCPVYELIDEPIGKFITLLAGEEIHARLGAMHGVVRECDARTQTGELFPVEISVSRVRLDAEKLYTAIVRDIRDRRAQQIADALGDHGLIARIGGDEFTVVLDAPELDAAATVAHRLAESLRAPIDVAGISIEVGVSIGIAHYPHDANDAYSLLRHADVAMYVAKRRGATLEYYDAAHDENTVRKLAIGGELRSAITNNALELHFQPQVNLRSGMVESAEALLRWNHPSQGAISPGEFIAIAEATDLIRPLTEWSLRVALAQIRAWRERGVHVRIAVNLSARLLQDTGFPAQLRKLLEESGVAASSLELEITESAMMLDPARALRVIQEIARLGVFISIDDFGTGYSSLGYLRDLPVNSLKLDRSFVIGMRNNTDDRVIVESTAQMAHALKLDLVAEGVETEWDARFLAAAGYDFAQGYHFSRPMSADKCFRWIVEFNATAMLTLGDTSVTSALRARAEREDDNFESRTA